MKRFVFVIAISALLALPAQPYTFNFTAGNHDHWATAPTFLVHTDIGTNITGSRTVTQVIQAGFATWANAPNSGALAAYGGATTLGLNSSDQKNVVCFKCTGDFSKDSSTLAVTITSTVDTGPTAGSLLDADIAFNPSRNFSTDGTGSNQDLETVAVHEIGHFFGLAHSGVVKAIMFPYAPTLEHTLGYDDVAAIAVLYPGAITVPTQSISGTVRLNGAAVFGAQVYAESQTSSLPYPSSIRKTPISALTDLNGNYTIQGVPNDSYLITAEPLDLPVANADIPDYSKAFGRSVVDTSFTTRWH